MGNGLNLAHYHRIERLSAIEPDPFMRRKLAPRLAAATFPVEVLAIPAERLPFTDAAFDAAVVCLVLCSVNDPRQVLLEVRRVLKPGGELRFLEHVRGDGLLGLGLDLITPLWSRCGGGCHPNRDTEATIRAAGFEIAEVERYRDGRLPHLQGRGFPS